MRSTASHGLYVFQISEHIGAKLASWRPWHYKHTGYLDLNPPWRNLTLKQCAHHRSSRRFPWSCRPRALAQNPSFSRTQTLWFGYIWHEHLSGTSIKTPTYNCKLIELSGSEKFEHKAAKYFQVKLSDSSSTFICESRINSCLLGIFSDQDNQLLRHHVYFHYDFRLDSRVSSNKSVWAHWWSGGEAHKAKNGCYQTGRTKPHTIYHSSN